MATFSKERLFWKKLFTFGVAINPFKSLICPALLFVKLRNESELLGHHCERL